MVLEEWPYLWFRLYLSNREQYVSVNGHNSCSQKLICGVPQDVFLDLYFLLFLSMIFRKLHPNDLFSFC